MADSLETDGRGQAHAGVVASAALLLPPRLTSRLEERCQGACTDIIRHARTHSVGKYQSCMLSGDGGGPGLLQDRVQMVLRGRRGRHVRDRHHGQSPGTRAATHPNAP